LEGVKQAVFFFPGLLRRLYDWVLSWAEHPRAGHALFWIALAESSFFPVPPDVLLIALALSRPLNAFRWASISTAGSVVGGVVGYGLGWNFMASVGQQILSLYHLQEQYLVVQEMYRNYDAWAVAAGGFTPLPYKLFTITAGAFDINFPTFVMASFLSRGARFFLVAGLVYAVGPAVKDFLERYFNFCTLVFLALLVGGYLLVQWIL